MGRRSKEQSNEVELTQESILMEAVQMFSEKGYRATSLEDVAAKLGVTRPAFYYYFKNKKEILIAAHRKAVERLFQISEILDDDTLPVKEKFEKLLMNHIEVVAASANFIAMYFDEEKELPKDDHRVIEYQRARRHHTETLIKLYRQGVEEGVFRDIDPKMAVFTFIGAGNWVYRWFKEDEEYDAPQVAALMVKILGEGYLLPDPGKETPAP